MNRSITENVVVVLAVAIAVSLLASACGPNKMKVLKSGKLDILPKTIDTRSVEEKVTDILKSEQQQVEQQQGTDSNIPKIDISKATEFANRISYIQFVHVNASQMLFKAMIQAKNGKIYEVQFTETSLDSSGKTILFSSNISKQVISSNQLSSEAAVLPYTAKAIILEDELAVVSIAEKESLAPNAKSVEISAVVRSNTASATVNAKDENIQLMKDAKISTRMTQIFVADSSVENNQRPMNSLANRIIINVSDKTTNTGLYDFYARFQPDSNSAQIFASNISEKLKGFDSKYDMTIESGDAFINSDTMSIVFKSKTQADQQESVVLRLAEKEDRSAQTTEDDQKNTQEEKNQNEVSDESSEEFEVYTDSIEKPDFSNVQSGVTSTAQPVKKADFSNVKSSVTSTAQIIEKPDFSNVTSGVTSSAQSAEKADFSNVISGSSSTAQTVKKADFSNVKSGSTSTAKSAKKVDFSKVTSGSSSTAKSINAKKAKKIDKSYPTRNNK